MDWKWIAGALVAFSVTALTGCAMPAPGLESKPAVPTAASLMPTPTPDTPTEPAEAPAFEEAVILLPTPTAETEANTSASLTAEQEVILAGLRSQGAAPELTNETWINSAPLQLADLRGDVVIVEFWTYG